MKKNNRKKSITTYHLLQFWKENAFWTDGYFVCSVGEASPETIQKYIQNQG
jgi:putative transposase